MFFFTLKPNKTKKSTSLFQIWIQFSVWNGIGKDVPGLGAGEPALSLFNLVLLILYCVLTSLNGLWVFSPICGNGFEYVFFSHKCLIIARTVQKFFYFGLGSECCVDRKFSCLWTGTC